MKSKHARKRQPTGDRSAKRKVLKRPKPKRGAKTLGSAIKEARRSKGLTQLALAHSIGYTGDDAGAYVSRVESDSQAPRLDTLQRIAEALGVAVCSLLGD